MSVLVKCFSEVERLCKEHWNCEYGVLICPFVLIFVVLSYALFWGKEIEFLFVFSNDLNILLSQN